MLQYYGCNAPIYWNPLKGEYWEVKTNKKHICPYLSNKEQMLKHHSVMVDILDKFEVLEKGQKKDVARKLIDSGAYIPK